MDEIPNLINNTICWNERNQQFVEMIKFVEQKNWNKLFCLSDLLQEGEVVDIVEMCTVEDGQDGGFGFLLFFHMENTSCKQHGLYVFLFFPYVFGLPARICQNCKQFIIVVFLLVAVWWFWFICVLVAPVKAVPKSSDQMTGVEKNKRYMKKDTGSTYRYISIHGFV